MRFGEAGAEKPVVISDGKWLNVSAFIPDYKETFFEKNRLKRLKGFLLMKFKICWM